MAQVYGDALYNSDGYWLSAEEYLEGDAVANATATGALFFIPQVYGDAAYNSDGYWLPAVEFLEGNAIVVCSSSADIYMSMDLYSNAFCVCSSTGDLVLVLPVQIVLSGTTISSSINPFGIIFSYLISGSSVSSSSGNIKSSSNKSTNLHLFVNKLMHRPSKPGSASSP